MWEKAVIKKSVRTNVRIDSIVPRYHIAMGVSIQKDENVLKWLLSPVKCVIGLGGGWGSIDSNAYGGVGSLVHAQARSDVSVTCYSLAEALDWSRQTFISSATRQPAQVRTNFQLTKSPTHYYFFAMYMIKRFYFPRSKTNWWQVYTNMYLFSGC